MKVIEDVMLEMIRYYHNDPKRIQHFTKVHAYAALIGKMEGLSGQEQETLELAALVHDIGIKPAEEKYKDCNGKLQEEEGPKPAGELLSRFDIKEDKIERIKYLVGHHHTYQAIDGLDYQILVEADFIVNAYEDSLEKENIKTLRDRIFKTKAGIAILEEMFDLR